MRSKNEEAVAVTTAPESIELTESYRPRVAESTEKLKIGTLLLALQQPLTRKQHKAGYRLLRIMLAARYSGGAA
jgi:hypothetical protein